MFNDLTGSSQYVGNWPGVTVEKKEGKLRDHKDVRMVDLPGIYSLSPYTLEEVVSRDFLLGERPDAIINIVDATNIERNLYLTTQLAEVGIPLSLIHIYMVRAPGSVIVAKNHIHMTCQDAQAFGVKDNQSVRVKMNTSRPVTLEDVIVRVSDQFSLAMHIDFDEANACAFQTGNTGSLLL